MSDKGIVYLVGAGPGAPDLLTVRGLRCLRKADVVVYDRLIDPELLEEAPPTAERLFVGKFSHPQSKGHSCPQEEINALLVQHARAGRTVVRLKGGDPFVFGRGGEEALACAEAGVRWEVVPGISSAVGVPASAGIPVTHRETSGAFAVVTGHCTGPDRLDWSALSRIDTLVVLMGVGRLPEIAAILIYHGRPAGTPVAVVEQGTHSTERTVTGTLRDIAEIAAREGVGAPATIVIGEVVRVREGLLNRLTQCPVGASLK